LQGEGNEVGPYRALTYRAADRSRRDRTYGGVATPASVTMAVMRWWGVMSNAGFAAAMPSGATGTPATCVISSGRRSSIGMADPSGVRKSTVDRGAATRN